MVMPKYFKDCIYSERCFFAGIFFLVLGISLGDVIYAAFHDPSKGEYGGVIGLTISLLMLITTRNSSEDILNALKKREEASARIIKVTNKKVKDEDFDATNMLDNLRAYLQATSQNQVSQNRWLAGATAVGTICSGFGEIFALWIKANWLF